MNMMNCIRDYNMEFVFEKLISDNEIDKQDVLQLELEFKKFIMLIGLHIYPISMISPGIDKVWHQFILFTNKYYEFCHSTVGFFIHHTPDTKFTPVPIIAGENFRSGYKKYFGNIPDIWYKGMKEVTKNYYLKAELSGKPPESWSGWAGPEK